MKQNCWEVKKCGREAGGPHVRDKGLCPATIEYRLDKVHDGKNAGRACWVVAGTFCGGAVQGSFASKYDNCKSCGFYEQVQSEESGAFKMSIVLLDKLKG